MTERVITELIIDSRGAVAGTAEYERAMNKASAAVEKVKAKSLDLRLAPNLPQSVDQVTRSFERLRGSIDPVFRAQATAEREMTRSLALVDRAVLRGVTTQQQAASTISALRAKQVAEIDGVRLAQQRLGATIDTLNTSQFRRQNLGFQAQDIAVGLYSGQALATVLVQQGSQIAGIYGGAGGVNALFKDLGGILLTVARYAGPWIAAASAGYGAYRLLAANSAEAALAIDDVTAALAAQAAPLGSVEGNIAELARLQNSYRDAITATGTTQDAVTAKIIANTQAEFTAKKSLMELEFKRQEASIAAMQSEIALAGLEIKGDIAGSIFTNLDLERRGFADPRVGRFTALPDELTGLEKTFDAIANHPLTDKIAELRANLTLTDLATGKLGEALKATFTGGAIAAQNLDQVIQGIRDKEVRINVREVYSVQGGAVGVTRHDADATSAQWMHLSDAQKQAVYNGAPWEPMLGPGGSAPLLRQINVQDYLSGTRAGGGPVSAGGLYMTGEMGPELFRPTTPGYVSSASVTADMISGASGYLKDIADSTYETVEELKRFPGYYETLVSDGQASLTTLRAIEDAIGALDVSWGAGMGGSTSGGAASGSRGGFSGGGATYASNDARSPYYYNAGGGRPGGAQYDPVADFMYNGNQGALGLIAASRYGMYEATAFNSPFDVNRNRFQTNADIANTLGAQGPSVGQYGGGLNITAESDFTSGGGFFANGGRMAAGGMGGGIAPWPGLTADPIAAICDALGITEQQLRQMQLSDIQTYGFPGGGAIHPGDTQRIEAWKSPQEAVAFFRPEQRAAVGEAMKAGDTVTTVNLGGITINMPPGAEPMSPGSQMALEDRFEHAVRRALGRP